LELAPGPSGLTFTGSTEWEADTYFPMLGVNLAVLGPGEPNSLRGPGDELAREAGVRAYGAYTVDEVARRHGACAEEETQDGDIACARVKGWMERLSTPRLKTRAGRLRGDRRTLEGSNPKVAV
jgi:hypothetical protein